MNYKYMELGSKMKWVIDLRQSLEVFGWKELDVEALRGLTVGEMKQILKDVASMEKGERGLDRGS